MINVPVDAQDLAGSLRALFAARRARIYVVASRVQIHPSRLSLLLNGRLPLTTELAERIARAIESCSNNDRPGA